MEAFAALGAADVMAARGEHEAALAAYRKLSNADSHYVPKDSVLLRLATILEENDDTTGALQVYQRLVEETPSSVHVSSARGKLDELGSQLEASAISQQQDAGPEEQTAR